MKKRLIALLAAGLSIMACGSLEVTQELETAASRAHSGDYDSGWYTVYFKNGKEFDNRFSGYDLNPYARGGKVTLYNYFNSDVKEVNGQLNNLNIIHSTHTTPTGSYAYGWNTFDTSNVYGIGSYVFSGVFSDEIDIWYEYPTDDDLYTFCIDGLDDAQYLKPYAIPKHDNLTDNWFNKKYAGVINFQKTNSKASLFINMMDKFTINDDRFRYLKQSPIEILYQSDRSFILDASNIYRFALNQKDAI